MLVYLVLCMVAVIPTAFSQPVVSPTLQQPTAKSNEAAHRYAAAAAAAIRQIQYLETLLQRLRSGQPLSYIDDTSFPLSDDNLSLGYWTFEEEPLSLTSGPLRGGHSQRRNAVFVTRALDSIGGGHLLRRDTVLDSIGGGHLLRRDMALDSIGGGHLLKRTPSLRSLDSIGGGHLLKRGDGFGQLDSIGGGHLLKRDMLDSIGGGHLLKRDMEYRQLDSIGGGHLLKRESDDYV